MSTRGPGQEVIHGEEASGVEFAVQGQGGDGGGQGGQDAVGVGGEVRGSRQPSFGVEEDAGRAGGRAVRRRPGYRLRRTGGRRPTDANREHDSPADREDRIEGFEAYTPRKRYDSPMLPSTVGQYRPETTVELEAEKKVVFGKTKKKKYSSRL